MLAAARSPTTAPPCVKYLVEERRDRLATTAQGRPRVITVSTRDGAGPHDPRLHGRAKWCVQLVGCRAQPWTLEPRREPRRSRGRAGRVTQSTALLVGGARELRVRGGEHVRVPRGGRHRCLIFGFETSSSGEVANARHVVSSFTRTPTDRTRRECKAARPARAVSRGCLRIASSGSAGRHALSRLRRRLRGHESQTVGLVSFFYHMYGAATGTFRVVDAGGRHSAWTKTGPRDFWQAASVMVRSDSFAFEYLRGERDERVEIERRLRPRLLSLRKLAAAAASSSPGASGPSPPPPGGGRVPRFPRRRHRRTGAWLGEDSRWSAA